ncbi:hypothetical protein EG329_010058 [Mollisiaceae sp. DMI_Dod_QoI]|nr:hypothetical protein EG329_010058 [Helotiales sp. DMI_Dod_QoI]
MIPSRGVRWSGQTIGICRRRLDAFSARQFSSVQHGPIRGSPLISKQVTSPLRAHIPFRSNEILRNGIGIRFASTTPLPPPPPATSPVSVPSEVVSSSESATPLAADYTTSLDSVTDFSSESLHNIPEGIGYLKALGLEYGWGPTALMEWTLEHIHILTGTPWWISIALTAIAARAVLFRPYIDAAETSARLATIQPFSAPITAKMQAATKEGDADKAMQLRGELQRLHKRAGIKPWKSFVPMLQIFAGYGTFFILRAMSKLPVPGLETGGALWFYNLTIPDPYLILPIATAGVLHWVLRKGGETGISNLSPQVYKGMMWGLPGLSLLFTWWLPASVQLSFFVAGLCSFIQATLLRQPWFRNYWNMTPLPQPKGPTEPSPYKGNLKVAANPVLSQAELNSKFQEAGTSPQRTVEEIRKLSPPKKVIGNVLGSITGTVAEIRDAGKGIVEKGKENLETRKGKNDAKEKRRYEEKRQEELKKERWELENQKRAERAARKRNNL